MHKFKQLKVYERAIDLGYEVRKLLKVFPKEEMFALSSQFRRAIDSVALNIAEGAGNNSKKNFHDLLDIRFVPDMSAFVVSIFH